MQYTGIAAYPRRVSEQPISFHQLTKIECFGIKGLLIAGNLIILLMNYFFDLQLVNRDSKEIPEKSIKSSIYI